MTKKFSLIILMFSLFFLTACNNTKDHSSPTIIKIVTGEWYSMALSSTGQVFTWGDNSFSQLGNGTNDFDIPTSTPIEITQNFNLQSEDKIVDIVAGCAYNFAISSTSRIFAWGLNWFGELGDGTTLNSDIPVEITQNFNLEPEETIVEIVATWHNIAISSTGRVFAWGFNDDGQLGDGTTVSRLTPVEITENFNLQSKETIIEIEYNMAISSTGRVFAWGLNDEGQLGDGTKINRLTPVEITQDLVNSTFCIYNSFSICDEEFPLNLQSDETFIEVFKGIISNRVITSTGRVFGIYIAFEFDETASKRLLIEYTQDFNLQPDETLVKILSGRHHTIALTSTGRVFTRGDQRVGQLGNGTIYCKTAWNLIEITRNFDLQSDETIVEIAAGPYHNIALTSKGRVFAWGLNDNGRLGDGTTKIRSIPVEITIK